MTVGDMMSRLTAMEFAKWVAHFRIKQDEDKRRAMSREAASGLPNARGLTGH